MSIEITSWAMSVAHQVAVRWQRVQIQAALSRAGRPTNRYGGRPMHVLMLLSNYADDNWQCWIDEAPLVIDTGGLPPTVIRETFDVLECLGVMTHHIETDTSWIQLHRGALNLLRQENEVNVDLNKLHGELSPDAEDRPDHQGRNHE